MLLDKTFLNPPPAPTKPARLALFGSCAALSIALAACLSTAAHAQGSRKPTVSDQTEPRAAAKSDTSAKNAAAAKNSAPATPTATSKPAASAPSAVDTSAVGTTTVRARRVSATESSAPSPSSTAPASASVPASGVAASPKDTPNVVADAATRVEAELEELRAQILDAKTEADRVRLQRQLADRLVELKRTADAVTLLRSMMRVERFDPISFYNIGNALARLDDAQAAAEAYRKAIAQKNGNYSRAQNNLGVVLIRLGHWDEASEALTAALRLESGNYAEASYNMGRLYALRGEAGLAINEWIRTLTLEPDHADAAVALARAYTEDGDSQRALKVLDAFSARVKRRGASTPREIEIARGEIIAAANVNLSERNGRIAADEGSAPANSASVSNAKAASDKNVSTNSSIANLPDNAVLRPQPLRSAVNPFARLNPNALDADAYDLLQRARAARESGRHEQSVTLYKRVIDGRGGYFAPANLELGYALTNLQRTDEAVAALTLVAQRDGTRYPVVFYHLGRLHEKAGRLDAAAQSFTRAAALYGDKNPQILLELSRVREKEGNASAALSAMEGYTRAVERLGTTPDWVRQRLDLLRQKANPKP
ncbi:MAG TPA: tetratricopeptide repeat protein [Pyrinomonadaceae bacterium]|jgi:tetratricopeptide (TPR) repeat protein